MNACEITVAAMHEALDAGRRDLPAACAAHIAGCTGCRDEWDALREAEELMATAGNADAPAPDSALRARILDAVARERTPGTPAFLRWQSWAAVAAVVVLGAFVAARFLGPSPVPEQPRIHSPREQAEAMAALPALADEARALASPPRVLASAREDFTWLSNTIVSSTLGAARAVGIVGSP